MATQINIPIDDNQTAPQVPFTPIIADATHVAVNATHVQAALLILAEYAKDRPTLGTMNTALANYANAFNASQTAQDAIIATKLNDAQNGLTKVGDKVELGGTLLHDTFVEHNGNTLTFLGKETFFGDFWDKRNFPNGGLSFKSTHISPLWQTSNGFGMGYIQSVFGKNFKIDPQTQLPSIEFDWQNNAANVAHAYCINLGTDPSFNVNSIQFFVGKGLKNDAMNVAMQIQSDSNVSIGLPLHYLTNEKLEINGNVKGDTAKFFSYVTLSDSQTKNIQSKVSAEQARLFIELFPDAIVYSHKDEYVPQEMKGKMFIGFDAREVEKIQKDNPNVFVPLTTQTQIDAFDKDSKQWDNICNAIFEPNDEQLEDEEILKQAKETWEVQKKAQRQSYEQQKASHEAYREQYDKILYLDQSSILPMLLMEMKRLNKRVAALEKPKPKRVYKKKAVK